MRLMHIAVATEADCVVAARLVAANKQMQDPGSRLAAGLRIADEWSRQAGLRMDVVEERRLELALARIVARDAAVDAEPANLGSVDYARMLLVDAAAQRDAEAAIRLDALDRRDYYSWMNPALNDAPWVRTDTSPSDFATFAEDDLKALAQGRLDEISGPQRENVELMLLRGASPRNKEFDLELHRIADNIDRPGANRSSSLNSMDLSELEARRDVRELARFGPFPRAGGLSRKEMCGVVDRLSLVRLAKEYKGRSQSLFDDRPNHNPFEPDASKDGLQYATVAAVAGGRIKNSLERATRVALEFQQNRGIAIDRPALRRMETAVMRFVSSGGRGVPVLDVAKMLVVDTAMQQAAAEKLSKPERGGRGNSLAVDILEDMVGRGGYPIFTRLQGERADTKAVAEGRFHDLTDQRGFGSAVRTAIYRSGRDLQGKVGKELDRIVRANPVGKAVDVNWIRVPAERGAGEAALRALSKGPSLPQPELSAAGLGR